MSVGVKKQVKLGRQANLSREVLGSGSSNLIRQAKQRHERTDANWQGVKMGGIYYSKLVREMGNRGPGGRGRSGDRNGMKGVTAGQERPSGYGIMW